MNDSCNLSGHVKRHSRESYALAGRFHGSFMGGMKFLVSFRVELTPEERDLTNKYKAHKEPLAYTQRGSVEIPSLRIGI